MQKENVATEKIQTLNYIEEDENGEPKQVGEKNREKKRRKEESFSGIKYVILDESVYD